MFGWWLLAWDGGFLCGVVVTVLTRHFWYYDKEEG